MLAFKLKCLSKNNNDINKVFCLGNIRIVLLSRKQKVIKKCKEQKNILLTDIFWK